MTTGNPTQRPVEAHLSEAVGLAISSGQWLLERPDDPRKWQRNNLDVKICGEEGFSAIAQDIMTARHSIDIICYGFDPAMELVRTGNQWPRGSTFGDLLAQAANAGKRVRVLCWYGPIGAEMRGAAQAVQRLARRPRETLGQGAMYRPAHHFVGMPGASLSEARREFNIGWYEQAFAGDIRGLAFRSRRLSGQAAKAGLAADEQAPARGALETFGMAVAATHHQKTILIDYDLEDGAHAVGYVMGLNSLTDYWDTTDHLFDQPLRGNASEGTGDSLPGLKPYQDYACRIRGEALADVCKNFCSAWNRTRATEKGGEGPPAIYRRQTGLAAALDAPYQCAQIVRTQPEETAEHSVRRLYEQAAKFARKYVYVENQYFQYTPWAEQLKNERRSYVQKWKAGQGNHGQKNTTPPPLPWLHVFVVVPTPERSLMVPRTHDTVKSLGHGDSMPNQDQRIEDELKRHRQQKTAYDDYVRRAREPGANTFGLGMAPPVPTPLSPLARDSQSLGDKGDIKKDLQAISMRTLVASLWTYDHGYLKRQKASFSSLAADRYREIYIHSKLLLIDDGFFTLGSANLNQRSMASDSEINVATDSPKAAAALRKRVWGLHTGGASGCNPGGNEDWEIYDAFDKWRELLELNAKSKDLGNPLLGFLNPFQDSRSTSVRAG